MDGTPLDDIGPMYSAAMAHRTQIVLTDAQYARLRDESERTGLALAELVRRAIDLHYPPAGALPTPSEVEAAIQTTLYGLMEGKTVIAIAHRLSTIARMDRIVVMDDGRIVEQGSHADLLALGGLYARFWARQSGGFIGADVTDATEAAE